MKNDRKMIKFTKNYLIQNLGFNEEEAKEIIETQKILPILQMDNKDWIDARDLHEQLAVSKDFTNWIKQQIEDLDLKKGNEFFVSKGKTKNDCSPSKANKEENRGGHNKTDYFILVSIAKEIAMIAGAKGGNTGKELKERSKRARKYYLLMEKAIRKDAELQSIRNPQKPVTVRISKLLYAKYMQTFKQKPQNTYFWSTNMDLVNLIAFGFRAGEINDFLERENDGKTRDYLRAECLERLTYLLEQQEVLIKRGYDFETRENELLEMYKAKYGNQLNPFTGETTEIYYERPSWWDLSNVI